MLITHAEYDKVHQLRTQEKQKKKKEIKLFFPFKILVHNSKVSTIKGPH